MWMSSGARTAEGEHVVPCINAKVLAQAPEDHGAVVLELKVVAGVRRRGGGATAREARRGGKERV